MKAITFEMCLSYCIYLRKSLELSLNIEFSVKTASFSAIFVLNFPTLCTLHHLSALDFMFTPVHTIVHPIKKNQASPLFTVQCTHRSIKFKVWVHSLKYPSHWWRVRKKRLELSAFVSNLSEWICVFWHRCLNKTMMENLSYYVTGKQNTFRY